MEVPSILVIGAGELGQQVLQSLAQHPSRSNTSIAVLLRPSTANSSDATKQKQITTLKSQKISVVEGDIQQDSVEQLASKFNKFHTVINCSGMSLSPGSQTKIAQAALASGCHRYFPWQFGVDYDLIGRNSSQDLFTEQLGVRDLLRSQDKMSWTIVSTGLFMSFLFEPIFGIVNAVRDTVVAIGSWENRVTVTTPGDIGRLTAELAIVHQDVDGVVFVAGDTVSMKDLADTMDQVSGGQVERQLKTVEQLKDELADDSDNGIKKYRVVFAEGVGVAWDKTSSFNARHGISTTSIEQYLREV